jgi:uncharacterized protein YcbX
MTLEHVGTVQAIYRYPVKSIGGESLDRANLRWSGIDGDRQFAFVRDANRGRFPWLTGRELSALVTYKARFVEPENPRKSPVRVQAGRDEYDLNDDALRARLATEAGEAVRLIQIGRGIFDTMPVSVLSLPTLQQLESRCGQAMDVRRFRPNIVVAPLAESRETEWLGSTLVFGNPDTGPRLRANDPIARCSMVTIHPESAVRDPSILRHVAESFDNKISVGCNPEALGTIAVGDRVYLTRT